MSNLSENIKNLKFMKNSEEPTMKASQNVGQWKLNFQIPQSKYAEFMQNRTDNSKEIIEGNINQEQAWNKYEKE